MGTYVPFSLHGSRRLLMLDESGPDGLTPAP